MIKAAKAGDWTRPTTAPSRSPGTRSTTASSSWSCDRRGRRRSARALRRPRGPHDRHRPRGRPRHRGHPRARRRGHGPRPGPARAAGPQGRGPRRHRPDRPSLLALPAQQRAMVEANQQHLADSVLATSVTYSRLPRHRPAASMASRSPSVSLRPERPTPAPCATTERTSAVSGNVCPVLQRLTAGTTTGEVRVRSPYAAST